MASDEKPDQQPSLRSSSSEKMHIAHDPLAKGQESGENLTTADEKGLALEPVQSRRSDVHDVSKVPNGGLLAWLQVFGAFFLTFNSWYIPCTSTKSSY